MRALVPLKFDVIVIGMGPGGEEVAGQLAEASLNVLGIEKRLLGGECPYYGCVPSKMMIRAANLLADARRVPLLAGAATIEPDWRPVAQRIRQQATDNWDDRVAVERFESSGGHFLRGNAKFVARDTVAVGATTYQATRGIVIATGTEPAIPPVPGLSDVGYWTNREAIATETLPKSLAVLGGGAIGLELAQVFSRFGVEVTVIEVAPRLLVLEEPEAGEEIAKVFGKENLRVNVGAKVQSVTQTDNAITIKLDGQPPIVVERLLVATGRRTDLTALSLENAGLDSTQRFIAVDEMLRAGENLWAVGDVTGKGAFTHIAMYQAGIATANILGQSTPPADYSALPRVTFTDPEIGAVGMTEESARQSGVHVRIGRAAVASSARGWIHDTDNGGFIKLIEDADRGVLVGATSMGPWGGEVLSLLSLAVHAKVPIETLRHMIYAYPTFHRGIEDALRDLVKN